MYYPQILLILTICSLFSLRFHLYRLIFILDIRPLFFIFKLCLVKESYMRAIYSFDCVQLFIKISTSLHSYYCLNIHLTCSPINSDFQIHLLIKPKPGLRLCSYFLSAYLSIHVPALSSPRFLSCILIYPAHTVQTVQFNQTNAGINTYAGIHPYPLNNKF